MRKKKKTIISLAFYLAIIVIPVLLTAEMRLFLIVILCGALGLLTHAVRSFILFVGNKEFCKSWTLNYVLRPFQGSLLGVQFYLVVRGGFFSPSVGIEGASPFGMVALAALVGLFSDSAMTKLKEISIAVFAKVEPAKNPLSTEKGKEECPIDQKKMTGNVSQITSITANETPPAESTTIMRR